MCEWLPIEKAPRDRSMFVAYAVAPNGYITDIYGVWYNGPDDEMPTRWPHPFPPTHCLIPPKRNGVWYNDTPINSQGIRK